MFSFACIVASFSFSGGIRRTPLSLRKKYSGLKGYSGTAFLLNYSLRLSLKIEKLVEEVTHDDDRLFMA